MTDLDRIVEAVGLEYRQERSALLATSRGRKDVAEARMVAMYLATRLLKSKSLTTIGKYFGRDRTTVRHARDKMKMAGDWRIGKLEKQLASTIAPV